MCRLRNIALESVTDGQTDRQTDGRTTDKVVLMCRYASQATQYCMGLSASENQKKEAKKRLDALDEKVSIS